MCAHVLGSALPAAVRSPRHAALHPSSRPQTATPARAHALPCLCSLPRSVWSLTTGECTRTLEGHTIWVTCVALSADGATLVSGSKDCTLR